MGSLNNVVFFLKRDDREKLNKRKKYNNCSAEIFMQMVMDIYFATAVLRNTAIQMKEISQLTSYTRGKNYARRVSLYLTARRRNGH